MRYIRGIETIQFLSKNDRKIKLQMKVIIFSEGKEIELLKNIIYIKI